MFWHSSAKSCKIHPLLFPSTGQQVPWELFVSFILGDPLAQRTLSLEPLSQECHLVKGNLAIG